MKQKSKTISKCQISGIEDLKSIISIGYLPPVNRLKKINKIIHDKMKREMLDRIELIEQ